MRKSIGLTILTFFVVFACNKPTTISNKHLVNKDDKSKNVGGSSSSKVKSVIQTAKKYLGTTYKYGGMDKKGIDCSGLVCNSFQSVGIKLPHQSAEMSKLGISVPLEKLQPGDLIFIGDKKGSKKITHVGIVTSASGGKVIFIHASTKRGVIEENLLDKWYKPLFIKGTRLF
jgi:probable lipoprotein NlpC